MDPNSRTQKHNTSNPYETEFGYSRGTRKGPFIFISGTTSLDPSSGEILHPTSAHLQATQIFSEIIRAVEALGGTLQDITRVRMYVTNDEDTVDVGRAMKEALGEVGPAATMIVGVRFVSSEMKVEIEADAVVLS